MLALIDGDILIWRIAATTVDETEDIAKLRMNRYIDEITFNAECWDYKIYLTDSIGNYRNTIYPEYKANRQAGSRPLHYEALKEYLIKYEAAIVTYGQEADDGLGIEQTILGDESIICSIDKDLKQIKGWHYNFVKNEKTYVTQDEADKFFWTQVLTGDATDNIPGLKGIGKKKADKLLEGCKSEQDFKDATRKAYATKFPDSTESELVKAIELTGQLVRIRRTPNELWTF